MPSTEAERRRSIISDHLEGRWSWGVAGRLFEVVELDPERFEELRTEADRAEAWRLLGTTFLAEAQRVVIEEALEELVEEGEAVRVDAEDGRTFYKLVERGSA